MFNSRLSIGIHVLALLGLYSDRLLTSEQIAGSVNTNSVVIRRLLASLRKTGYVESKGGASGGWRLIQNPQNITLLDVRTALSPENRIFDLHPAEPSARCLVGRNILGILDEIYDDTLQVLDRQLARTTIASVMATIKAKG